MNDYQKPLRLMAYNILEGLRRMSDPPGGRHEIDRERTSAILSVIGEFGPDILVLNEALYCREYQHQKVDYAGLFGFAFEAAALNDGAWGNAVLSRYPILETKEMRIHNRGGLSALVETPAGKLTVATYHPHPSRASAHKAADFAELIGKLTRPLIVCGDFNSINPEDAPDRPALINGFRRFSTNPEAAVDQVIESGVAVFGLFNKLGLKDAVPKEGRRYSIPTDLLSLDKGSAMRLDHVVASADVEVVSGAVIHSPASNRASDHYPVTLEFLLR